MRLPEPRNAASKPLRAIRLSTLEALCGELECQPGDLLAYGDED